MTVKQLLDKIEELKISGDIVDGTPVVASAEFEFKLHINEENDKFSQSSRVMNETVEFELDSVDSREAKLELNLI